MPVLYDFECQDPNCGMVTERMERPDKRSIKCPNCGARARKIISASGAYCGNQDATWLKSVTDIIKKDTKKTHEIEFLKNPTRDNLKRFMDGNNLRHLESGEKTEPKPWRPDGKFKDQLTRRHQERNSVRIGRI